MRSAAVTTTLFLALASIAAPAFAQHMNADSFYQRAVALKKKGAMAMFSVGEVKALLKEAKAAGLLVRQTRLVAEKGGGHGRYCPPPGARRLNSDEYITMLGAISQPERKAIDLVEATTRMMEKKFPCRT